MATKNDKIILNLKQEIEEKKKLLNKAQRFTPVTNCNLEINGNRVNINVLTKDGLLLKIAEVKALQNALKSELPEEKLEIGGFSVEHWLEDLKSKFSTLNVSLERDRLKKLEEKLHGLLSLDTKVELEIESLKNQI